MARTEEERKVAKSKSALKWRENHREQRREYNRKWQKEHPNRVRERGRKWDEAHPNQVRERKRKYLYGITPEVYEELFTKQNGQCAICGGKQECLTVDHEHTSHTVRGLLCRSCNIGLGHFMDNPDWLRKAADYLQQTSRITSMP